MQLPVALCMCERKTREKFLISLLPLQHGHINMLSTETTKAHTLLKLVVITKQIYKIIHNIYNIIDSNIHNIYLLIVDKIHYQPTTDS